MEFAYDSYNDINSIKIGTMDTLKKYWWLIVFVLGMVGNEVRKARKEGGDASS